jgi:hypothetical protein
MPKPFKRAWVGKTGLLRDPEKRDVAQKPYIFFQKMRPFFYAQTLQASLGKKNRITT